MAKPAQSFFYDRLKFVPLGRFWDSAHKNPNEGCKSLIQRSYTLCEVEYGDRQFFPVGFCGGSQAARHLVPPAVWRSFIHLLRLRHSFG